MKALEIAKAFITEIANNKETYYCDAEDTLKEIEAAEKSGAALSQAKLTVPEGFVLVPIKKKGEQWFWEEGKERKITVEDAFLMMPQPQENPVMQDVYEKLKKDAARYRYLRELDGGSIYKLLGDYDGMHGEVMDSAIDASINSSQQQE